mgnify:CR=1 FL=1
MSIEEPRKKQNSKEKEGNKITEEEGYRLVRPKYLRSEANDTIHDNLLKLPRM